MTDGVGATKVTSEMAAIVGEVMRESRSHPVSVSDIRKWAIAVYYPDAPPALFWDEEYAATTSHGGIVAPEEFNPFAWTTQKPSMTDPKVAQTAFSENELGVQPPEYTAMLMTEIRESYGRTRIRPGDVIRSTVRISNYFEREGRMGHMLYTTLANELRNQNDKWLRTTESVYVRY
ncbi:MAG: MaoC family dehydratase N-terminal domain-containing protein [Ilumatobacter sp.]|nr:MaoC family dehydratase N-terminal domain-containing protein [Ilumatobacter sp.]